MIVSVWMVKISGGRLIDQHPHAVIQTKTFQLSLFFILDQGFWPQSDLQYCKNKNVDYEPLS